MPQPNTLRISFTPLYTGLHRVCYRVGGVGPYDCTTVVSCTSGVPQIVDIPFDYTVINDTCNSDTLNGYVQPTCVPVTCSYLQTAFSFLYSPYCRFWTIECTGVAIDTILPDAVGGALEYTPGADIPIVFLGGGGINLDADAHISNGAVASVLLTTPGTGYTPGTFTSVPITPAGAQPTAGIGLIFATVVIAPGGFLASVTLAGATPNTGSGFVLNDTFTLNIPGNPGAGDIIITVNNISTGQVQYVTINDPGDDYTSIPTGSIGGSATFDITLAECPAYDMGNDCSASIIGIQPGHPLGWKYFKCEAIGGGNPVSINGWTATLGTLPTDCCYECEEVTFNNVSGGPLEIYYVDYALKSWSTSVLPNGNTLTVQIVKGTGWIEDASPVGGQAVTGVPCP